MENNRRFDRNGDCNEGDTGAATYIRQAWDTLTRSMDECASLADVKVMTHPVLYLPAGLPVPAKVADLQHTCYVQVRALPRAIERMGDVKPEDLPTPGLLYLPHPYVVPGGRFNEMYGWDSYFIVLGLLRSGLFGKAKGMVDNLLFEVEYYGAVLNANRTYYLTRSQPPFLASMIRAIHEAAHEFEDPATSLAWLAKAFGLASRFYDTWVTAPRIAGSTGLARYYDQDCGPVPELADDSTYFQDVIEWLLANPNEDPGYLVYHDPAIDSDGKAHAPELDCNPRTGAMREPATVRGYRLTNEFYLGDRAMRESGFDSCFRFGPFCGSTHHYAPVCLNSLLVRYERDMAYFAEKLDSNDDALQWTERADERTRKIQQHLWREDRGLFLDYDFKEQRSSSYGYLSAYYPMWAGLATLEQAARLRDNLKLFEQAGGLTMSTTVSGMQWDAPYGWAPSNWMVVEGLLEYGYQEDACRIARIFMATVDNHFRTDATVREKYDVVRGDGEVQVSAGYKDNVIGFGWTNGVYLKIQELLAEVG